MPYVNFKNLDGTSYQKSNAGGLRTVLVILSAGLVGNWPKEADVTAGEIVTAPTLAATYEFAQYEFPDGTAQISSELKGDPGFQSYSHSIELMVAGFSKEIQAELKSHLNAGAVWIVEMNDGSYAVVGSSDNPLFSTRSFTTGKKGSDKRGFTLKGTQDGFMIDIMPLATSVVEDLVIQG